MKSKYFLPILFATVLLTNPSRGQLFSGAGSDTSLPKIEFGIKAGANIQALSGSIWDNGYQAGMSGGLFVRMFKNKVGGRAEVLLSTAKFSSPVITDTFNNKGDFRATYIEVPVMFEYSVKPRVVLSAGVQYSNLVSIKNLTDIVGDIKKIFKQSEFSAVAGIEVKLPYNLSLGGRYRFSLSNVNNEPISGIPGKWSTSAIQFFVCYKIK